MRKIHIALITIILVFLYRNASSQKVYEKEEINKSFRLVGTGQKKLVVDNINGYINVVGYDGETIELVAHKEIEAEDKDKIEEAKHEIVLDIKEENNKVILYVDAPWRVGDGINYRDWHYYGYDVTYDFDLKVPYKTSLFLKTVNRGGVTVKDVEGEFDVRNVNAGIELTGISGPARVTTVNGRIEVRFKKNPELECSFKTVNGKVEVAFQEGLSADLRLKTFNGHVYTDFDVTDLPRKVAALEETRGKRHVWRKSDSFSVRVGKGGPEFSFDTLNGNIYILKQED